MGPTTLLIRVCSVLWYPYFVDADLICTGVNDVANDVGVPQKDDQMMDQAADSKVNSDIPFGNN